MAGYPGYLCTFLLETSWKESILWKSWPWVQVNKIKVEKALNITFMSSDESEVEEDGTKCIITNRLPWLSDVVENVKRLLDE